MTNRPIPIHTNHRVDLYIPSQCICGGALSDDLRDAVLVDVKTKFDSWFGGHSEVQVLGVGVAGWYPRQGICDSNLFALQCRRA